MDFRNNGIGLLGMTAICEALKNNDVLGALIMGTNSVGDEGAELLARYMAGRPPPSRPESFYNTYKVIDLRNTGYMDLG